MLAAEITGRTGSDPGQRYVALANEFGSPVARRAEAPATVQQKKQLAALTPQQFTATELAGDHIDSVLSHASGNGEPVGGVKVNTTQAWYAARPSGTENLYKINAESFAGLEHLQRVLQQAQTLVDAAILPAPSVSKFLNPIAAHRRARLCSVDPQVARPAA